MPTVVRNTFGKEERICGRSLQEKLFSGSGKSMAAFPVRAVCYMEETCALVPPVRVMMSVPKKCFKRAVKRNRVKRQLREAYRLNKHHLSEVVASRSGRSLLVAFIWLDTNLWSSADVERKMKNLLSRIAEKIAVAE